MKDFIWLTWQAGSALISFWEVTTFLLFCLAVSGYLSMRRKALPSGHLIVLAPTIIGAAILAFGALMENTGSAETWHTQTIIVLFHIQVFIAIFTILIAKGFRWFASFAVCFQLWFGIWCAFVSTMAVTGDWL